MNSLPSLAQRIVAIPVALILPPLGVFLARGVGPHFYICLALFALSVLIFFALYAGVGLLLYVLAGLYGLLIAIWMTLRRH
jgi:uncharacterized membrane protein YqaE (UPF0057 family)